MTLLKVAQLPLFLLVTSTNFASEAFTNNGKWTLDKVTFHAPLRALIIKLE